MRDDLVAAHKAAGDRSRALVHAFFPQLLEVCSPYDRWFTKLWRLCPTQEAAKTLDKAAIADLLRSCRVRMSAEELLAIVAQKPVTVRPGVRETSPPTLP
jgi:hypothetical protein